MERPYLGLQLVGPGGGLTEVIPGLIDTGADTSVLPFDLAPLLGYSGANLEFTQAEQAQGPVDVYEATEPCIAWIFGAQWATFTMKPMFIAGTLHALWGRQDFLQKFPVAFYEERKEFVVTIPDENAREGEA